MRTSARISRIVRLAAFASLAVLGAVLAARPSAQAQSYNWFDIQQGFFTSTSNYDGLWHSDEGYCMAYGSNTCPAADLNIGGGTGGSLVGLRTNSNRAVYAAAYAHEGYWSSCRGTDIWFYDNATFQSLGQEHYVHINSWVNGTSWVIGTGPRTRYLGTVHSQGSCPYPYWTGPHLHQSGMEYGYPLRRNYGISPGSGTWQDWWWLHHVVW